jgi:hypothetical protein
MALVTIVTVFDLIVDELNQDRKLKFKVSLFGIMTDEDSPFAGYEGGCSTGYEM